MSFMHKVAIALGAAALCASLAFPAQAEKTIKLPPLDRGELFNHLPGTMTPVFRSLLESGLDGWVTVRISCDGQLGKDAEVIRQTMEEVI